MNGRAHARLQTENELRRALERGELFLHYQPNYSFRGGAVTGVEALLRWQHSLRGPVSPTEFIPIAEDTGAIVEIGEWVLAQAYAEARTWHEFSSQPPQLAVNMSARQLWQLDLPHRIRRILHETQFDSARLEIEITESSVLANQDAIIRTLRELRAIGVRVSLDDFGTGYSSISHLKNLPPDRVKIDGSFVRAWYTGRR